MSPPEQLLIRPSEPEDLPDIQAIYAHHVRTGRASFEETPPDLREMRRRREEIVARDLPYLVAETAGRPVGYAYAGPYRPRSAYRFTLEDSIYLVPAATGRGIGRQLLDALIERTTALGYRQMLAVIGDSGNRASIALHARAGFREVGVMRDVGFKFGGWLDVVIMQRPLGSGAASLPLERASPGL